MLKKKIILAILIIISIASYSQVKVVETKKGSPILLDSNLHEVSVYKITSKKPLVVNQFVISIKGDYKQIEDTEIRCDFGKNKFSSDWDGKRVHDKIFFKTSPVTLQEKTPISFLLRVELEEKCLLDSKFEFELEEIYDKNDDKIEFEYIKDKFVNRPAKILKKSGDDGVPLYRIPAVVTAKNGSLIAVYDVRRKVKKGNQNSDLPNNIKIGMSKSTDNGETWSKTKIILDKNPKNTSEFLGNGVGDPSILIDDKTGTIFVGVLWSKGDKGWTGSKKGLSPDETGQMLLINSKDNGETWSEPINITEQVKDPEWSLMLFGPGIGITLKNGTLVFPVQYRDGTKNNYPYATIIYSNDGGKTWTTGRGFKARLTESQIVQLKDGSIMINCRDDRNTEKHRLENGGRTIFTTADLGKSWVAHPTSDWSLIEPNCQASFIRINENTLAFFNPATGRKNGRQNFTLKLSYDDGENWLKENSYVFDRGTGNGYSSMTVCDDSLCIIYEGSLANLVVQKIKLNEILK